MSNFARKRGFLGVDNIRNPQFARQAGAGQEASSTHLHGVQGGEISGT
jgi:hypothetical protein